MELWLDEGLELSKGRALKVKVTKVFESFRTEYQLLEIVETQSFGRMMLLDGVIMFTDMDEFCYHEMITHVPLMSHPAPERVLIIGGGDGGVAREVLKHPSVKEVCLCDIDKAVSDMSIKYFPQIACALNDPRVKLFHEDGAKFIERHPESFDAIIVDSTDPIGPGESLFQKAFYESMKRAMRPGGVASTQAESFQYHREIIGNLFKFLPQVFKQTGYYWTSVPTYPSGIMGFTFLSDSVNPYSIQPDVKRVPQGLKCYSAEIHKAALVLPPFAKEFIKTSQG